MSAAAPNPPRPPHGARPDPDEPAEHAAADSGPPRIPSTQLFGSGTEVHIEHRGAIYRLRQTALGKLILTK
jgi:hemin uptake protein HemP